MPNNPAHHALFDVMTTHATTLPYPIMQDVLDYLPYEMKNADLPLFIENEKNKQFLLTILGIPNSDHLALLPLLTVPVADFLLQLNNQLQNELSNVKTQNTFLPIPGGNDCFQSVPVSKKTMVSQGSLDLMHCLCVINTHIEAQIKAGTEYEKAIRDDFKTCFISGLFVCAATLILGNALKNSGLPRVVMGVMSAPLLWAGVWGIAMISLPILCNEKKNIASQGDENDKEVFAFIQTAAQLKKEKIFYRTSFPFFTKRDGSIKVPIALSTRPPR